MKLFTVLSLNYRKRWIILYKSNIKVIFADKITAGLDPYTQKLVRLLIERLKIDHHIYESLNLVKIGVIKQEVTTPNYLCKEITNKKSSCYEKIFSCINISNRYDKIKEVKEIKYPPKVSLKND